MPSSGLTRVMHSIMENIGSNYNIHYIGISYRGPIIEKDGMRVYPSNLKGGDVYGAYQAKELIESVCPDLVFILKDIWNLKNYRRILSEFRDSVKVVAYCPMDGKLSNDDILLSVDFLDRCVAYNHFGKVQIENSVARIREQHPDFRFPDTIDVIAHGIDASIFHPWLGNVNGHFTGDKRLQTKRMVFGDRPNLSDSFIVLNANRPSPRKRIDLTLKGFALFARNKPKNVLLYLHHAIMTEQTREELVELARLLGIEDRLILTGASSEHNSTSDEEMNMIYNACDVGINTSIGEGWGLINFEHAATGAAQIVPGHSAFTDLWKDSAVFLNQTREYLPGFTFLEMAEIAPEEAAECLEKLYRDRAYLEKMSIAAYRNVVKPEYRWKNIAREWDQLFQEMLA